MSNYANIVEYIRTSKDLGYNDIDSEIIIEILAELTISIDDRLYLKKLENE